MAKLKQSTEREMALVFAAIESLFNTFLRGKELVSVHPTNAIQELDSNNPDYVDILNDQQEQIKIWCWLIVILLAGCVDYLLFSAAISIICVQFQLPLILKWIVPFFLIALEVIVSYVCIINERSGEWKGWFSKLVKYFVFGILIGLAIVACLNALLGYRESLDGSFIPFSIVTILYQTLLLIASILLHLWIIHSAERIVMAIGYFRFKMIRDALVRKESRTINDARTCHSRFVKDAASTCKVIEKFHNRHSQVEVDFTIGMPEDFIIAVNKVMGREVLASNRGNNNPPKTSLNG